MKKVILRIICLFLVSSLISVNAQEKAQNSTRYQKMLQEEKKVDAYIQAHINKPLSLSDLQEFIHGFNDSEHGLIYNALSKEEQQEHLRVFKEQRLRYLYFKDNPQAWNTYQARRVPACENGGFEDPTDGFNAYEGQSAIGNPGGYVNGECSAVPTSGFGGFNWTPTTLDPNTNNDNFTLVSAGNDPIVATGGGNQLSMINPNSPDPNNSRAVRINSARPLPSNGSCSPNRGINRLIKPITLTESGIQVVRFYYALVAEFPNHNNRNPIFIARALDGNNAELDRICVISNPAGNAFFTRFTPNPYPCPTNQVDILWQDWTCAELKISGNVGDVINLEFIASDCGAGAHFGYAYIDDICVEECQPGDNFQGSIRLNEFDPCEVTLPFDVCADFTLPQLNGQTGTLSANDTSLDILQGGVVVETLTNGVINGNTVCFTVNQSDFPSQSGGYDFQVNAEFSIGNGMQTADDVHTIPGQDNDYIFNNPECCDIAGIISNIVCYDQGTTDPSDDTWTFDLTVTNSSGGTWNATTPNADSGGYGNPTTIDMGEISNFSGSFTFLVADDADPSCSVNVTVEIPDPCSPPCEIEVKAEVGECNDNGTPSDYSDDFYYVTITVNGTNGLPWMAKKKLESDGSEMVLYNGNADVNDLQLGPIRVSEGAWTLWVGLTEYYDCLVDIFIPVPDCCNDEPYIEPYWQHPACPEVVCTADFWPIHVLSSDGNPVETAGGIVISWDNLGTPEDENIISDWIYTEPSQEWQATITYPNGCEYVVTYYEDCCDEDIFINVLECPTSGQLQAYEEQLLNQMATAKTVSSRLKEELDLLQSYMSTHVDGEDCDPCEIGFVLIELVDAEGEPIDISMYYDFIWSDGSQSVNRLFTLPMDEEVCFSAKKEEYGRICTYTDCFFYDCEEECLCDELVLGSLDVIQVNECLYSIAASSSVNCASDQIAEEEYSFVINGADPITSSGNGIYHTFTENGTYTITMTWTVTDIEGCTETVSITDTVEIKCVEEEPCEAPAKLRYDCRTGTLDWSDVPNANGYIVEINWDDSKSECCRSDRNPRSTRWETTVSNFQIPIYYSSCFSWRIGVKCPKGTVWTEKRCSDCFSDPKDPKEDIKTEAKISPNPNDGNMNIEITGANKTPVSVKVYRFDGMLVKAFDEKHIENELIKISWNGKSVLNKGIYFFIITTDKDTITKKVIIE